MSVFAGIPALTSPNDPLVSINDFQEWFSVTAPSDADNARIQTAIEIASGLVRAGRRIFSRIDDDVVFVDGGAGGSFLLPRERLPVRSITSITNLGVSDTSPTTVAVADYDWSPSGIVTLTRGATLGAWWTERRRGITVTYSHGYDPIPRDVAGVVLAIAKRWYDSASAGSTASGSLVKAESLGDYSVSYDTASSGLLESEAFALRQYEAPA